MELDNPSQAPLIGIFDSGVGGFTVYDEIQKITQASCLYYGDCARAPYGDRTEKEIVAFVKEILAILISRNCTHFVSACNSMSVHTTDLILAECGIDTNRYVDMIRAFKKYSTIETGSRVVVAATQATIESGEYQAVLKDKGCKVYTYVFPSLAKKIEDGISKRVLKSEITECILLAKFFDATHLVYGCTHYPLVDDVFVACAQEFGWTGTFVNPATCVAIEVGLWDLTGDKSLICETSKETDVFVQMREKYTHN